MTCWGSGVL